VDNDFRMKRLVEISRWDHTRVRLVETSSKKPTLGRPYSYVALSHCWGGSIAYKLTKCNEESLKEKIEFQHLPRNFQDAIRIAAGLGVRHIWIDSLCILQKRKEHELDLEARDDFDAEAPNMGRIYTNALCTVSSTASTNADGGCFHARDRFFGDCPLVEGAFSSLIAKSWIREPEGLEYLFLRKIEEAPITKRGWTFQERTLSRRVLHFCDGVVNFECNTLRATEYHPDGIPYATPKDKFDFSATVINARSTGDKALGSIAIAMPISWNKVWGRSRYRYKIITRPAGSITYREFSNRPFTRPGRVVRIPQYESTVRRYQRTPSPPLAPLPRPRIPSPTLIAHGYIGMRRAFQAASQYVDRDLEIEEELEFHQNWYELVEPYSARQLTHRSDKLTAIMGVAYFIQSYRDTDFLAGLWRTSLPFNLLWTCETPNLKRPGPPPDEEGEGNANRELPTWSWASVDGRIRHQFTPDYLAPDASTVRAASIKGTWKDIAKLATLLDVYDKKTELSNPRLVHRASLRLSCRLFSFNSYNNLVTFVPDLELDISQEKLFCMPVMAATSVKDNSKEVQGIVVRRTKVCQDESVEQCYERVGYFSIGGEYYRAHLENTGVNLDVTLV
jgi:hypothetical protein